VLEPYDKILTCYDIDELASKRLGKLATISYLRPDSWEMPNKAVTGVMQLAEQLKVRSYTGYIIILGWLQPGF